MYEYFAQVFNSLAEFNQSQERYTTQGWELHDFRVINSPDPHMQHGIIVMWKRVYDPERDIDHG